MRCTDHAHRQCVCVSLIRVRLARLLASIAVARPAPLFLDLRRLLLQDLPAASASTATIGGVGKTAEPQRKLKSKSGKPDERERSAARGSPHEAEWARVGEFVTRLEGSSLGGALTAGVLLQALLCPFAPAPPCGLFLPRPPRTPTPKRTGIQEISREKGATGDELRVTQAPTSLICATLTMMVAELLSAAALAPREFSDAALRLLAMACPLSSGVTTPGPSSTTTSGRSTWGSAVEVGTQALVALRTAAHALVEVRGHTDARTYDQLLYRLLLAGHEEIFEVGKAREAADPADSKFGGKKQNSERRAALQGSKKTPDSARCVDGRVAEAVASDPTASRPVCLVRLALLAPALQTPAALPLTRRHFCWAAMETLGGLYARKHPLSLSDPDHALRFEAVREGEGG
jgi:hypothetical protein